MRREHIILASTLAAVLGGAAAYYIFSSQSGKARRTRAEILSSSNSKTLEMMVEQLVKLGIIQEPRVARTMLKVDRAFYVPDKTMNPYKEGAAPIGFNATISAPHMHAIGLDLLSSHLQPGAVVLDVGSGSGYVSACLADLVYPSGRVYGIDHIPDLVERARSNIQQDNPRLLDLINFEVSDGFEGLPAHAPYDAIYVGAASEHVPGALVDQLKPGGKMVIPIGSHGGFQNLVLVTVAMDRSVTLKNFGAVRFVPLTTFEGQMENDGIASTKITTAEDGEKLLVHAQYHAAPDTTPQEIRIMRRKIEGNQLP